MLVIFSRLLALPMKVLEGITTFKRHDLSVGRYYDHSSFRSIETVTQHSLGQTALCNEHVYPLCRLCQNTTGWPPEYPPRTTITSSPSPHSCTFTSFILKQTPVPSKRGQFSTKVFDNSRRSQSRQCVQEFKPGSRLRRCSVCDCKQGICTSL